MTLEGTLHTLKTREPWFTSQDAPEGIQVVPVEQYIRCEAGHKVLVNMAKPGPDMLEKGVPVEEHIKKIVKASKPILKSAQAWTDAVESQVLKARCTAVKQPYPSEATVLEDETKKRMLVPRFEDPIMSDDEPDMTTAFSSPSWETVGEAKSSSAEELRTRLQQPAVNASWLKLQAVRSQWKTMLPFPSDAR